MGYKNRESPTTDTHTGTTWEQEKVIRRRGVARLGESIGLGKQDAA
jgi:hypothetical protein